MVQTVDLPLSALDRDMLRQRWGWLLGLGFVWILLGVMAILMTRSATFAVNLTLGVVFAVGGAAQLIQAFQCREWRGFGVQAFGGILALAAGALLFFYPLVGVLTLTLLLAAFFVLNGALKIVTAFEYRGVTNWGWFLLSGILGIAVGLLLWAGWPSTALWAIGLLVGIELVFYGISSIMLALAVRTAEA